MTREIKFRTYGTFAGVTKMQEVYPCGLDSEGNQLVLWNGTIFTVDNLMQYTGLLDKNGKEIYEGDRVRYCFWDDCDNNESREWKDGVITWNEEKLQWDIKASDEFTIMGIYNTPKYYEVIGNIYETV